MKKTLFAFAMIAVMAVGNVNAQGRHHHNAGREIGRFFAGAVIGAVVDNLIATAVEAAPVVVVEEPAPVPNREIIAEPCPEPVVVYRHAPAPVYRRKHAVNAYPRHRMERRSRHSGVRDDIYGENRDQTPGRDDHR